jgi:hypothetical protein
VFGLLSTSRPIHSSSYTYDININPGDIVMSTNDLTQSISKWQIVKRVYNVSNSNQKNSNLHNNNNIWIANEISESSGTMNGKQAYLFHSADQRFYVLEYINGNTLPETIPPKNNFKNGCRMKHDANWNRMHMYKDPKNGKTSYINISL